MKIIDKIKEFFNKLIGKEPQKLLNKPKYRRFEDRNKASKQFRENIKYEKIVPQGLDFALDQYISYLIYQKQNNENINSYGALVSLGAMKTEVDAISIMEEQAVLNRLKNRTDIKLDETYAANGSVSFYHVAKNRKDPINYRLYLNCKNKNLPNLVNGLINEMEEIDSYYFKFNPQMALQGKSRSEQIVFYSSDEENLNKLIRSIQSLKTKQPQLFEGSKNGNPFLKKIDGYIAYAPQPKEGTYKMIDGTEKTVDKSYNSLLADALEDSFVHSIRDLVLTNVELFQDMNFEYHTELEPYVQKVLEKIDKNDQLKKQLINKMKVNLAKASNNNRELDIVGIPANNVNKEKSL